MKIIGIAASPRKKQSTYQILSVCLDQAAREPGVEVELIELAGKKIAPCISCGQCRKELTCSQKDDFFDLIPTLDDPALGGLILASPVYMGGPSAQAKAFLDRSVSFRRNGFRFARLVGGVAAVGGSRNGGQEITIQTLHAGMLIHGMTVVGDAPPTAHFGGMAHNGPGGVLADQDGLATAANLGKRVAQAALALYKP